MMIMINALYVATENLGIYHVVETGWGHALVSCRLVGIPACLARVRCRRDLRDSLGRLQHQKSISRNSNSSRPRLQIRVKIDDLEPAYYHYLSTNFFANYLLAVNADRWTDSRSNLQSPDRHRTAATFFSDYYFRFRTTHWCPFTDHVVSCTV